MKTMICQPEDVHCQMCSSASLPYLKWSVWWDLGEGWEFGEGLHNNPSAYSSNLQPKPAWYAANMQAGRQCSNLIFVLTQKQELILIAILLLTIFVVVLTRGGRGGWKVDCQCKRTLAVLAPGFECNNWTKYGFVIWSASSWAGGALTKKGVGCYKWACRCCITTSQCLLYNHFAEAVSSAHPHLVLCHPPFSQVHLILLQLPITCVTSLICTEHFK